jgi:hypothetical protein
MSKTQEHPRRLCSGESRRRRASGHARLGVLHAHVHGESFVGGTVTKWSPEHHRRRRFAADGGGHRREDETERNREGEKVHEDRELTRKL